MTTTWLNPYEAEKLHPKHLELLFPASFYQTDEELSQHMTESCLIEQMTWEGDSAVGETAFWLKVLSTPQSDYLKTQKRLFKLAIAERCRDISGSYKNPAANKPPSVVKLALQQEQINQGLTIRRTVGSTPQAIEVRIQSPEEDVKEPKILIKTGKAAQVNQTLGENNAPSTPAPQTPAAPQSQQQIVVDQMISENDWELIEKHLSGGDTNSANPSGSADPVTPATPAANNNSAQNDDEEAEDAMEVYGTTTPGFGIKTYRCKLCQFAADNRTALNKHQKSAHSDQLPFSCDRCDYSSKYAWSIKTHIDSVHLKTKRFQCPDCSYATSQACFLRRHTMRVHNNNPGEHKCPYCDYTAHHPNTLQRHVNRQHTHNFAHKCPYCDFGRDCKYLVEDHINEVHLKKVIYQCSECSFQTYKQRSLKSHHKTHQTRDVVRCSECDYRSVSLAGLTRHIKDEHPDTDAKATLAGLKTKSTFKSGTIKGDADDYTAVLMGKCKHCHFTTDNVVRLKSHVRSAHRKKNIQCEHCAFKAANKKGLARHMTNKHPDKMVRGIPDESAAEESMDASRVEALSADDSSQQLPIVAFSESEGGQVITVTLADAQQSAKLA